MTRKLVWYSRSGSNPPPPVGRDSLVYGTYDPDATTTGVDPTYGTLSAVRDGMSGNGWSMSGGKLTVTGSNVTLNNVDVFGSIVVKAPNLSMRNFRVRGFDSRSLSGATELISVRDAAASGTFTDGWLIPDIPTEWMHGIQGHDYTARRLLIDDVVDYFGVFNQSKSGAYSSGVSIKGCYGRQMAYFLEAASVHPSKQTHNDGVQNQGGWYTEIVGNVIRSVYGPRGQYQPAVDVSPTPSGAANLDLSCIMLNDNIGTSGGMTVTDNLFIGGWLPLNFGTAPNATGMSVLRNRFDGSSHFISGQKPYTINLDPACTGSFPTVGTDRNYFSAGTYVGQGILVRGGSGGSPTQPLGSTGGGWTLVFNDDFSGSSLDITKWSNGTYPWGSRWNAGTDEVQWFDPAAISFSNSIMTITAQVMNDPQGSGRTIRAGIIHSHGHYDPTYGWFECRMKMPAGALDSSVWPAFWLAPSSFAWPPEIDVMEYYGGSTQADANYHYGGGLQTGPLSIDINDGDWNVFACNWRAGIIDFYYNGTKGYTVTTQISTVPMYLLINLAISPGYNSAVYPLNIQVDWVRGWA